MVDHASSDSHVVVSICGYLIMGGRVHPQAHKDVVVLVVGMMEVKAMFVSDVHQVALGWPESNLDRADSFGPPELQVMHELNFEGGFFVQQGGEVDNL